MKSEPTSAPRKRGRPRAFDREAALKQAMLVFWQKGYEGASLEDLLQAMKMSPSSLYAAFGDKRELFAEAVRLYVTGQGAYVVEVLQEARSAREGIERLLARAAEELSRADQPKGCLVALGELRCASEGAGVDLGELRKLGHTLLHQRLAQGQAEGEIPAEADTEALARFFATVMQGLSVQARDGASREELERTGRLAMKCWPGASPEVSGGVSG